MFFVLGLFFSIVLMVMCFILSKGQASNSPFECGFQGVGSVSVGYSLYFFMLLFIFLLFDLEIIFLLYFVYSSSHSLVVAPLFLGIVFLTYYLEVKSDKLGWSLYYFMGSSAWSSKFIPHIPNWMWGGLSASSKLILALFLLYLRFIHAGSSIGEALSLLWEVMHVHIDLCRPFMENFYDLLIQARDLIVEGMYNSFREQGFQVIPNSATPGCSDYPHQVAPFTPPGINEVLPPSLTDAVAGWSFVIIMGVIRLLEQHFSGPGGSGSL